MKEFLANKGGLAALQPTTRFALALFLVFALASYGVMVALGLQRSGLSPESIALYYGGATPDEAKSSGELLETTHFHLFAMPMQLFVLGHVFLLGRAKERWRLGVVLACFAGAALDLAAPWLVQGLGPGWAWSKIAARALLAPTMLVLTVLPLVELARGPSSAKA
jgi:hypothetical protein